MRPDVLTSPNISVLRNHFQKSLDVFMTIARLGLCDFITQLKELVMILQEPDFL